MTEFKERWERMTVVERIAYIRDDWAKCGHTDDPMVLRIASAVAHDVCRQAADELELLRAERDEVRQSYCLLMEAYRGGDGRVTANKLGWGYLFEEDKP